MMVWILLLCFTLRGTYGIGRGPCTQESLEVGEYLHPHPSDPTKYIQCTQWGTYHVGTCPVGTWSATYKACVQENFGQIDPGLDTGIKGSGSQNLPQDGDPDLWFGSYTGNGDSGNQNLPQDGDPDLWFGGYTGNGGQSSGTQTGSIQRPWSNELETKGSGTGTSTGQNGGTDTQKGVQNTQWLNGQTNQWSNGQTMNGVPLQWTNNQGTQGPSGNMVASQSSNRQATNSQSTNGHVVWLNVPRNNAPMPNQATGDSGTATQWRNGQNVNGVPTLYSETQNTGSQPDNGDPQKGAGSWVPEPPKGNNQKSSDGQKSTSKSHDTTKGGYKSTGNKSVKSGDAKTGGGSPGGLNPCEDANVQYVTNPTNPFKYYECVNGQAISRDCPDGYVWIQREKQCKSLQPGSGHENPNPCLSGDKYLPHPDSDSMYIECIGWYRQETRYCPQGQVWAQNQQRCVDNNYPTPTLPTTPMPQTTQPQHPDTPDMDSFCLNATEFYHAYSPDTSRFIQCDEFGNMYLRYCGPYKFWNDVLKTCVGNSDSLKGDPHGKSMQNYQPPDNNNGGGNGGIKGTYPPSNGNNNGGNNGNPPSNGGNNGYPPSNGGNNGYPPTNGNSNGGIKGLYPPANGGGDSSKGVNSMTNQNGVYRSDSKMGKVNTVETPEPFLCPVGSVWMEDLVRCSDAQTPTDRTCPAGMAWLQAIQGCFDVSMGAQIYNNLLPVDCPELYTYDLESGECKPSHGNMGGSPQCAEDFVWDRDLQMCFMKLSADLLLNDGVNGATGTGAGSINDVKGASYPPGNQGTNNVNGGSYPQGNTGSKGGIPLGQLEDLTFLNPCTDSDQFYHAYPTDPRYFIQCDEQGAMFIHQCGYSLVWDQEMVTCVPWSVMLGAPGSEGSPTGNTGGIPGAETGQTAENPCVNSDQTMHEFPFNQHMYIMCAGSQPYVMPCPMGLVWDQGSRTCNDQMDSTQ